MRYTIDTNAWIQIFERPGIYEKLLAAFRSGGIEVRVHQENIWELTDDPRIDLGTALHNKALLKPFLSGYQVDGIFVLGHSALGTAKVPERNATRVFDQHLKQKTEKEAALNDAIHLVNALDGDSTLVTCDRQVKSTAASEGLSWLCLWDFIERNGWQTEEDLNCPGCRK